MPSREPGNTCLSQISVAVPCDICQPLLKARLRDSDFCYLIRYLPFDSAGVSVGEQCQCEAREGVKVECPRSQDEGGFQDKVGRVWVPSISPGRLSGVILASTRHLFHRHLMRNAFYS